MHTILFVCTGNTCRSPLAEAIAQHWIDQGVLGSGRHLAASAGVAAASGIPPSPEVDEALTELGMSSTGRSKPLTADMIRNAQVVFVMTEDHAAAACELVHGEPDHVTKIMLLVPDGSISDPIGMGQAAYDALARQFMELIPKRLKEVFADEDRAGVGSQGT